MGGVYHEGTYNFLRRGWVVWWTYETLSKWTNTEIIILSVIGKSMLTILHTQFDAYMDRPSRGSHHWHRRGLASIHAK